MWHGGGSMGKGLHSFLIAAAAANTVQPDRDSTQQVSLVVVAVFVCLF